jgi:CRP-like cAMP-binding protein
MVYRHYNKNDIVFKEGRNASILGDPSNEFFIIIDGSVNVYVRKKYDRI